MDYDIMIRNAAAQVIANTGILSEVNSVTVKAPKRKSTKKVQEEFYVNIKLLHNKNALGTPCAKDDKCHGVQGDLTTLTCCAGMTFNELREKLQEVFPDLAGIPFDFMVKDTHDRHLLHARISRISDTVPVYDLRKREIFVRPRKDLYNGYKNRRLDELCFICINGMADMIWVTAENHEQVDTQTGSVFYQPDSETEPCKTDITKFGVGNMDELRTMIALIKTRSSEYRDVIEKFSEYALRNVYLPKFIEIPRSIHIMEFLKRFFYKNSLEKVDILDSCTIRFEQETGFGHSIEKEARNHLMKRIFEDATYETDGETFPVFEGGLGWFRFRPLTTETQRMLVDSIIEFFINSILHGSDPVVGLHPILVAAIMNEENKLSDNDYFETPVSCIPGLAQRGIWRQLITPTDVAEYEGEPSRELINVMSDLIGKPVNAMMNNKELGKILLNHLYVTENEQFISIFRSQLRKTRLIQLMQKHSVVRNRIFSKYAKLTVDGIISKIRFVPQEAVEHLLQKKVEDMVKNYLRESAGDQQVLANFVFLLTNSYMHLDESVTIIASLDVSFCDERPFSFATCFREMTIWPLITYEQFSEKLTYYGRVPMMFEGHDNY